MDNAEVTEELMHVGGCTKKDKSANSLLKEESSSGLKGVRSENEIEKKFLGKV